MSASLAARTFGKVAQYGLSGTNDSATIGPFDSGTVIGTVPPGKAGLKQISGVIQNASDLTSGGVTAMNESLNFLPSSSGTGLVPTVNAAQDPENGLSLSPEHE